MAERYSYGQPTQQQQQQRIVTQQQQPLAQRIIKTAGAVTVGGSMMVLSGLSLVATVIGITLMTPLLVIFSPVLVPAAITVFLIVLGFLSSGGFGIAALSVISWLYRYVTGKRPVGADALEQARMRIAGKARHIKETVGPKVEQVTS